MATEHRNIADAERHEPKGASVASAGQVLRSLGGGVTGFANPSVLNNITMSNMIEGVSLTSQGPVATDTPYQVTWGGGSANADISIASNGVLTLLTSGLYYFTFNLNMGRANNTGTSVLLARLLINDVPTGFVQVSKIDTSVNISPLNANILRSFVANDTVKIQIMRDSSGANDGGLITVDPVLAGWDNSPSAAVRIQKVLGGF